MTPNKQPLVSVVTPVYNGANYLRECIESVRAQTYSNWDYTIVNNWSTDDTLKIANEYARRDSRIRIHNNEEFVRVIANHNIAFRQISPNSKYCKVVAADDWIFEDCLQEMVQLAEANPQVAIVGAYGLVGAGVRTRVQYAGLAYPSPDVPGHVPCRFKLLDRKNVVGAPTNVLYRSDIVRSRHSFYNESNLHADAEAYFEFLEHHHYGFVHKILTFRREQEESLTSFAAKFNLHLPCELYDLVTYGSKYLTKSELNVRISEHLRSYYEYLGKELYLRRGAEFWQLHEQKLSSLGYPLSTRALYLEALKCAPSQVLSACSALKRVATRALGIGKLSKRDDARMPAFVRREV